MSKDSETIIKTIKSGNLPPIQTSKSKEGNGKSHSQRGIGITTFELNKKQNKTDE